MLYLLQIGFLPISFWDVLDVLIVGFLLFQVYKLLRGSLGFNVFLGLISVYFTWWLVAFLNMPLLSNILGQFVSVGMIALLVLFQPELRRFLILVGQNSLQARFRFLDRIFPSRRIDANMITPEKESTIREILRALDQMAETKTGALILFAYNSNLEGLYSSGIQLHAEISTQLILSIFNKESPLHDGAMIISESKIIAASCVLPVSERADIPQKLGLRHRAAIGISEVAPLVAVVVSEETGRISYVRQGQITINIPSESLHKILVKILR
jgi:uncharacterized protein (TIGR00159 family)